MERTASVIGTAIGVFAVVLVAGLLALWLVQVALDDAAGSGAFGPVVLLAAFGSALSLVRSERD
jgi:hypothetical protein